MAAGIRVFDGVLDQSSHRAVADLLTNTDWTYGAFSGNVSSSRYWYRHFSGVRQSATELKPSSEYEQDLAASAPLIFGMWRQLSATMLRDHALIRCYANAYPYGSEGSCHVDSDRGDHFTSVYYPCLKWHPDFGGETIFFNQEGSDIIAAAYPRPNRLVTFPADMPHVARGVTSACPVLRITLMFKTAHLGSQMD